MVLRSDKVTDPMTFQNDLDTQEKKKKNRPQSNALKKVYQPLQAASFSAPAVPTCS